MHASKEHFQINTNPNRMHNPKSDTHFCSFEEDKTTLRATRGQCDLEAGPNIAPTIGGVQFGKPYGTMKYKVALINDMPKVACFNEKGGLSVKGRGAKIYTA